MPKKKINKHYFDVESEAMYYVLGACYARNVIRTKNNFTFQDSNLELVEIVKMELESEHKIHYMKVWSGTYTYAIGGKSATLCSRLAGLGLDIPKEKRAFPEHIPERYLSHFLRGFFDAQANINYNDGRLYIGIFFNNNHLFLLSLDQILREHAKARHGKIHFSRSSIRGQKLSCYELSYETSTDCLRIHDFIYTDFDLIKEQGIYLPSNREVFALYANAYHPTQEIEAIRSVERTKKLILEGKTGGEISETLGYSCQRHLCRRFKAITHKTMSQYARENGVKGFWKSPHRKHRPAMTDILPSKDGQA